ncbi:esterase-like activity of phytase family protein [Synechococcus sp. RSCCF101]|uniref:choice-of-anchor I domain-containing protein n=1 Tax=Synechococcus sp. RSCCF101 TaxID=2511069 RepID=UPI00177FF310|nr:esterase-like activity of phytase family protein [Synechococcus sp. RSCCF101]
MAASPDSSIDLGGAEIAVNSPDHDAALVITGGETLKVVDISDPTAPVELTDQEQTLPGDAQSVDVASDLAAVAVANPDDARTEPGTVEFFRLAGSGGDTTLESAGSVQVGNLPDSLAFNADGSKVVVANEGEPNDFYGTDDGVDPPGSISVIDVDRTTPANSLVTNLGFDAAQTAWLQARGVRISGVDGTDASTDLEPEYVAIYGDQAFVTLQENNAVVVVDLQTNTISEIRSLGIKDWFRGTPTVENIDFSITYPGESGVEAPTQLADPNFPDDVIIAGGLSGLWYDPGAGSYYTISDRGPQAQDIPEGQGFAFEGEKVFNDPEYPITIYELTRNGDGLEQTDSIVLNVPDGSGGFRPSTGIGQLFTIDPVNGTISGPDDAAFTPDGSGGYVPVSPDAFGLDTESVLRLSIEGLNEGNPVFAVSDEYRPQVAFFDAETGNLVQRIVPMGTDYSAIDYEAGRGDVADFTLTTLPEVYSERRGNRGFEGMVYNSDDGLLYAFIQSPMSVGGSRTQSEVRRVLAIDPLSGTPQAEYVYVQVGASNQDKIGDAVYDAERGVFYAIDRDSGTARTSNKSVLELDFSSATDVLPLTTGDGWTDAIGAAQPELFGSPEELSQALDAAGINPVAQLDLFNLPSIGANPAFDKPEGLALLPDGSLVVGYDNDFLRADGRPDNQLSVIRFDPLEVDTSDRDGAINPGPRDFYGLRMPDSIATFVADGEVFTVTANEGDGRVRPDEVNFEAPADGTYYYGTTAPVDEAAILKQFTDPLDGTSTVFITDMEVAGSTSFEAEEEDEFFVTLKYGPVADDDFYSDEVRAGKLDEPSDNPIVSADGEGRLKTIADLNTADRLYGFGGRSITIYDSNGNVVYDSGDLLAQVAISAGLYSDGRSDDKGTEPEGVATTVIGEGDDAQTFAFVGLERTDAVSVAFNVTDPYNVTLEDVFISTDSERPEGLEFLPGSNGEPGFLMVANEDSGTLDFFSFPSADDDTPAAPFTLELLHVTDQEAGSDAIVDAPNLSAVLNALRNEDLGNDGLVDNTLTLSSGDAFIPGVFFDASEAVFGAAGVADIEIQNELGFQAIALGNHEFDLGTEFLAGLIDGSAAAGFDGTDFPYLATNLDFSSDPNLAPLETAGGQAPQGNVVTSSTLIDVNGETIGVVGATTPTLASISSPGQVGISPTPFDPNLTDAQLDALAAEIQSEVDALLSVNPSLNKIVLLGHMQQIAIEEALAARLEKVDIIVAGGSNTRLVDENDRLRDGDSAQGEYPTFITNAGGSQTAVVNTDGSYKYVGRLVIDFDADGNIVPQSYDPDVSGAYATDDQGVADLNASGLVDPEVQDIVDRIEAEIIATEGNVLGVSDVFLNGNRSGTFAADDPDGVRTQETNLGNLTADANLAAAQAIDDTVVVSLKNGGGIRASIGETVVPPGGSEAVRQPNPELVDGDGIVIKPEGGISQTDIQTTLAFNNGLTLLTLTKEELVAALEHGVSALPDVSGRFPQIAGVEFSFDPAQADGDRIESAVIVDENGAIVTPLVQSGELVGDPEQAFRIVTLDFLARPRFDDNGAFIGAGDGYPLPNFNTDPSLGEVASQEDLDRIDPVALEQEGVQTGDATFADDGTEQDALAEFLLDNFPDSANAFDQEDVGPDSDERIQNLEFSTDSVFPPAPPLTPPTGGGDDSSSGGGEVSAPDDSSPSGPPANSPIPGIANSIVAGSGDDTIAGGVESSFLGGGAGNDAITGGGSDDDIRGNSGDDNLDGGGGNDFVRGGQGRDVVTGNSGDDQLLGDLGSDSVIGGDGDDILNGNVGADSLTGGAGADQFRLSKGNDVITDFSFAEGDLIAIVSGQEFRLNQVGSDLEIIRDGFGTTTLLDVSLAAFEAANPITFL